MSNYTVYQLNQEIPMNIFWLFAEYAFAVASNPNRFWVKNENIQSFEAVLSQYGFAIKKDVQS